MLGKNLEYWWCHQELQVFRVVCLSKELPVHGVAIETQVFPAVNVSKELQLSGGATEHF